MLASRKTVLFYNNTTREKTTTDNFDVTMVSFDSAKIADLLGIYILDTLVRFLKLNNIGIYRDYGSISIPNSNGPRTSKIQEKSSYMGLKIEISSNLKIVNFVDVTLNLNDNSYKPFSKPNAIRTYTNVNSTSLHI